MGTAIGESKYEEALKKLKAFIKQEINMEFCNRYNAFFCECNKKRTEEIRSSYRDYETAAYLGIKLGVSFLGGLTVSDFCNNLKLLAYLIFKPISTIKINYQQFNTKILNWIFLGELFIISILISIINNDNWNDYFLQIFRPIILWGSSLIVFFYYYALFIYGEKERNITIKSVKMIIMPVYCIIAAIVIFVAIIHQLYPSLARYLFIILNLWHSLLMFLILYHMLRQSLLRSLIKVLISFVIILGLGNI